MFSRIFLCSPRRTSILNIRHLRYTSKRLKNMEQKETFVDKSNEPIKYSTSDAAKWKAVYSSSGEDYFTTPRIQPLVVVMSLTAFMVYFCILREENDLDDWLRELEVTVPIQVEEAQLRAEIQNGKKRGIDVYWKERRLQELVKQRESRLKQ